jgi:hypothetical protein
MKNLIRMKLTKKTPVLLVFFGLIVLVISCKSVDGSLLEGHWRASEVIEEGTPLATDLSELSFTFQGNFYSYYNTAHLEENGVFEISGNRLITIDTSKSADLKKKVQIVVLTKDSLHLRMNAAGKEQILKLYRTGESEPDDIIILD